MATAARNLVPAKARKAQHGGKRNPPGGRPAWQPAVERVEVEGRPGIFRTESQEEAWNRCKRIVRHYTAIGYPQDVIARIMEPTICEDTLRKHFAFELDNGKLIQDARMAGTAYQLGVSGRDPGMTRFWLRARMGWRDHGEVTAPTVPIQFQKIEGDDW